MKKYHLDSKTQGWLRERIDGHFDGRPKTRRSSYGAENNNLVLTLDKPAGLTVYDGTRWSSVVVPSGSEFVAFRAADSDEGVIASIFEPDGSQWTFHGDRLRIVYRTNEELDMRGRSSHHTPRLRTDSSD